MSLTIIVDVEELNQIAGACRFLLKPKPIITICAWCPTKAENDRVLKANGFQVSHGICPTCKEKLMGGAVK